MMRRAGVLLHPTALPGPLGMGDLGTVSRVWIDRLADSGTRVWQVLPMHPTSGSGEGGCPYLSPSAFALEESLISLGDLRDDGLLVHDEIRPYDGPQDRVDFHAVAAHRIPLVRAAAARVSRDGEVATWRAANEWVEPWARFRAIAATHGADWRRWPADAQAPEDEVALEVAAQFLVARQWARVAAHAEAKGVEIWGDVPIFVDLASCDVWQAPGLWKLTDAGEPVVVSGVPPDVFTEAGQKWGHPLYYVEAHRASGHAWWLARIRTALKRFDHLRIDHFRGLAACWEVPAHDPDARNGTWQPGLGAPLLEALGEAFGRPLPLFAEDLGVITPDVEALRDAFGLAGMAVLQFGLDGNAENPHHPDRHREHQVVYTGTHDTDSALGWARSLPDDAADRACGQLGCARENLADALIDAALASRAETAIALAQDLVGSDARINRPGTWEGNWAFRLADLPSDAQWAAWRARLERAGRA